MKDFQFRNTITLVLKYILFPSISNQIVEKYKLIWLCKLT